MNVELINDLKSLLQGSDAKLRKHWAEQIVREKIPVANLMTLLHGHEKTAQRFTWLIGDLLDVKREVVADCLPLLFELRDQMPFPGMRRSVAKCFWYLGVPDSLEQEAIPQLFEWLENPQFRVGVKHYASRALFDLAIQKRIDVERLDKALLVESKNSNKAHASRMTKLRTKLQKSLPNEP